MDIIFIKDLTIDTVIGVYDWEKKIKQQIVLDIEMTVNIKNSAKTDNIKHTVDYKAVSKRIQKFVSAAKHELVETLAEQIANIILHEFNVKAVKLKVDKGKALTGAKGVGIIIYRQC